MNMMDYAERLYARCQPVPETGCWLWEGRLNGSGYGWFDWQIDGVNSGVLAHRASYAISTGAMPSKTLYVLHKCDTPSCINPSHLFLGTQLDNMADMKAKGRGHKGHRSGGAKLSGDVVVKIRELYQAGGVTHHKLAAMFNISKSQIGRVLLKEHWAHL